MMMITIEESWMMANGQWWSMINIDFACILDNIINIINILIMIMVIIIKSQMIKNKEINLCRTWLVSILMSLVVSMTYLRALFRLI